MKSIKRIVLSGGGTGGHIYPALALYEQLQLKYPELEVLYIGSRSGLESQIVAQAGLPFEAIEIQGFRRSLSLANLKTLWLILTSTHRAKQLLKQFNPDVVVGTGGFVCGPVLYAATRLAIPTLIHEQNSVAGVTNKILSKYVSRIATCFEAVHKDFAKVIDKVHLTGNPRAQAVAASPAVPHILSQRFGLDDTLPTVLVFGGSRGAPAINQAAIAAIPHFAEQDYQVLIATGQSHYDQMVAQAATITPQLPENVRIVPYIADMPQLIQAIDLVVCRSGATTLTELTALGIPSLLIPSPFVTANHQEFNAKALVDQGAAKMILERDLTAAGLFDTVQAIMTDASQLTKMAQAAKAMGIPNAADLLIEQIEAMI